MRVDATQEDAGVKSVMLDIPSQALDVALKAFGVATQGRVVLRNWRRLRAAFVPGAWRISGRRCAAGDVEGHRLVEHLVRSRYHHHSCAGTTRRGLPM